MCDKGRGELRSVIHPFTASSRAPIVLDCIVVVVCIIHRTFRVVALAIDGNGLTNELCVKFALNIVRVVWVAWDLAPDRQNTVFISDQYIFTDTIIQNDDKLKDTDKVIMYNISYITMDIK